MLNLTSDEVLTTTRSVRKRLDLTRPVDRAVVTECLDIGFQAANGSNNQAWEWVIVDDAATRAKVADIYRAGMKHFVDMIQADPSLYLGRSTGRNTRQEQMGEAVAYLNEHMHKVPVLVIPMMHGRMEGKNIFYQASQWGSIWPAIWNFMLACRSRGLGTSLTTVHLWKEKEMADLLGIPFDKFTQAGLIPVGYTIGDKFKRAERKPASEMIRWNKF